MQFSCFYDTDCLCSSLCHNRTVRSGEKYSVHVMVGDLIQDSPPNSNTNVYDRTLAELEMTEQFKS